MKQPDFDLPPPPLAPRRENRRNIHGFTLDDPYAWLRDAHWRDAVRDPERLSPDIRNYLDAENRYVDECLADDQPLRDQLVREMRGRMADAESSVPMRDGPWLYFERFRAGGEHPAYCRIPADTGDTEAGEENAICLLDGDALASRFSYFDLGDISHSRDHRLLAYSADYNGAELYELKILDIETGEQIGPGIPDTTGDMLWSAESDYLFYVTQDKNHRPCKVWRLAVGQAPEQAVLIYNETDPGFFVSLDETQSGLFLLVSVHDHETGEVHALPAAEPLADLRLLAARRPGVEYAVEDDGDRWIILTNDSAEDFCLMTAPLEDSRPANWRPLVAHEPGRLILAFIEYAEFRVRLERANALPRLVITHKPTGEDRILAFDDEAYSMGIEPGYQFEQNTLRYVYSAPHRPDETWDFDMRSGERLLRKCRRIPSGHDPDDYVVRRIQAHSEDGEDIPVTLLHRRGMTLNGRNPCLLYGYGAYGISESAHFSGSRLSVVDRGVVYAIAHVRGGKEKGYRWYRQGKGERKQNSFNDFICAARSLCELGYTAPGRIASLGGSAGGLLVGAAVNQAPTLFGAVVADVPFVDTLNTMLDESLPLTPPEWPEWGNPKASAAAFQTIRAYCPYENIRAQDYPPMLVIAGVSDPRVTYWEPAKWVARLRANKTDSNLLLLKTHMDAGHGGLPGRYQALEETALIHAFLIRTLGLPEQPVVRAGPAGN